MNNFPLIFFLSSSFIGVTHGQYDYYSSYYYYYTYPTYYSSYYYYTYDTTEATKEPPTTTPKPTLPTTLATTTAVQETDLRPSDFGSCVLFIIKLCITEGLFVKARGSSTPVNALNPYYLNTGSINSLKWTH